MRKYSASSVDDLVDLSISGTARSENERVLRFFAFAIETGGGR